MTDLPRRCIRKALQSRWWWSQTTQMFQESKFRKRTSNSWNTSSEETRGQKWTLRFTMQSTGLTTRKVTSETWRLRTKAAVAWLKITTAFDNEITKFFKLIQNAWVLWTRPNLQLLLMPKLICSETLRSRVSWLLRSLWYLLSKRRLIRSTRKLI